MDHFGLESINDLPGIEELKSAGLLDKRPAIEAYRVTENVDVSKVNVAPAGDVDEFVDEDDELPLAADLSEGVSEISDAT